MNHTSKNLPRPTPEQITLIKRFTTAYNSIDKTLRSKLGLIRREEAFKEVVRKQMNNYPTWRSSGELLLEFGDLRNALVHNETHQERYLGVPLTNVVEKIEEAIKRSNL